MKRDDDDDDDDHDDDDDDDDDDDVQRHTMAHLFILFVVKESFLG